MRRINKINRPTQKSSPTKSLSNLFKLVAIVAFIKFELIYQQPVSGGRTRGLIYNKDGKFIYRPPKSSQGHIIVIDDRHRDNRNDQLNRVSAAAVAAETVYQPVRLIGQRVYHPGAQLAASAAAAPPIARAYYPGEQVQLINLNNLQGVVQHPILGHQAAALAGVENRPRQAILQSPAALQALRPPLGPLSLPFIQVYQPNRPSELAYVDSNHQSQVTPQQHHLHHQAPQVLAQSSGIEFINSQNLAAPALGLQYATRESHPNYQAARVYEADTPVGAYDIPLNMEHHSESSVFDDSSSPYAHMKHSEAHFKQLGAGGLSDLDDLIGGNNNQDPLSDQLKTSQQVEGSTSRLRHEKPVDRGQNLVFPLKRIKLMNEVAPPGSLGVRNSKRNTDSKLRQKEASRISESIDNQGAADSSNLNANDGKGSRYWGQFKDQFDIVH